VVRGWTAHGRSGGFELVRSDATPQSVFSPVGKLGERSAKWKQKQCIMFIKHLTKPKTVISESRTKVHQSDNLTVVSTERREINNTSSYSVRFRIRSFLRVTPERWSTFAQRPRIPRVGRRRRHPATNKPEREDPTGGL
jgi:hypothetical protein